MIIEAGRIIRWLADGLERLSNDLGLGPPPNPAEKCAHFVLVGDILHRLPQSKNQFKHECVSLWILPIVA